MQLNPKNNFKNALKYALQSSKYVKHYKLYKPNILIYEK